MRAAYEEASRAIASDMVAEEAREGVDAFLSKRPPSWKA